MLQSRHKVLIDDDDKWRNAWCNFTSQFFSTSPRLPNNIWEVLKEDHKCHNVIGAGFIEFDTEEDAIVFLLKWS